MGGRLDREIQSIEKRLHIIVRQHRHASGPGHPGSQSET
jgi:hypothetical protein